MEIIEERVLYLKDYEKELIDYKTDKGWELVGIKEHEDKRLNQYFFRKEKES